MTTSPLELEAQERVCDGDGLRLSSTRPSFPPKDRRNGGKEMGLYSQNSKLLLQLLVLHPSPTTSIVFHYNPRAWYGENNKPQIEVDFLSINNFIQPSKHSTNKCMIVVGLLVKTLAANFADMMSDVSDMRHCCWISPTWGCHSSDTKSTYCTYSVCRNQYVCR